MSTVDEDGLWFHDRAEAQRQIREGLKKGKLSIQLRGVKLKGSFALVRTKQDDKSWLLIKHKDRFVTADDITLRNRSVLSNIAVEKMKFAPAHRVPAAQLVPGGAVTKMPAKLEPMQAETSDAVFNKPDWLWEPKLDGYRVLAFIDAQGVKLRSRRGLELAATFPALSAELAKQGVDGMVLDGEVVAFDAAGKPSFNALQNRVQLKSAREIAAADQNVPTLFFAFDLLHFAGIDLRARPYEQRRRYLEQCLLPSPLVQLVHAEEDGIALHAAALASGFEGVIGKRKTSAYEAGKRSSAWLKVKPTQSADFVIGGYTSGKGSRAKFGALLVGYWDKDKLRYASHVGSGFDERTLQQVQVRLQPLQTRTCPFVQKPVLNGPTTWVRPELSEMNFQQWTTAHRAVFLRLRDVSMLLCVAPIETAARRAGQRDRCDPRNWKQKNIQLVAVRARA